MSQRQILTGGVKKTDILPLPTLFAEPSSLFFTNRDDTASFSQSETAYTNAAGLTDSSEYFLSYFAAVTSAVQNDDQLLTVNFRGLDAAFPALEIFSEARLPTGQQWMTTSGFTYVDSGYDELDVSVVMEDVSPIGSILAAGILGIPTADIGVENQDWFATGIPKVSGINDADTDTNLPSAVIDIKGTEDYLVFWSATIQNSDPTLPRNVRFQPKVDDHDVCHVRTDSTSGGATRSGRGFSFGVGDAGISDTLGDRQFHGVSVMPLQKGNRSLNMVASIAETTAAGSDLADNWFVIRKAMFEQAAITKVTTRQQNTSETHLDTDFQVAINSTKKVWIVVSSSYMGSHPNMEVVLHRENAGGGGDVDLIQPIELRAFSGATTGQLLNTDQSILPLWLAYVDDNPGDVVYTLQLGRNVGGSDINTINMRDDGTDGFDGYIMALELSFGTNT